MVAVIEVDAGQAAKRSKAADEKGKTPPSPPPQQQQPEPVLAVRRQRQPTPDHPPYCWMIGEAIDVLCENGGSEEDSISAFIRARYPGVPAAHDRLLRHYLDKHVADGFFVFTAAGRYLRCPEENTSVEPVSAGSSEEACAGSPVVVARRGRGRPRKDGSSSTSPASKKDGPGSVTPKRRGRRRAAAGLAAADDTVPASPVAVAHKDGIQAESSTPKRRGRLRRLGMATATDSSGKALVAGKKDGSEVPYTTDKEHEPPRELALVIVGDGSATTSIMDKACAEAPPTRPVEGDQPLELALVTTTDVPVPTPAMDNLALVTTTGVPVSVPTPAMDDGSRNAPSFDLALVVKNDSICTTPAAPESSSQASELVLVVVDDSSVPVLVADEKDGVEEAPSATNKYVRQLRQRRSAPTAAKKAGGKDLSDTPKGRLRQRKPAVVATDGSARTTAAGNKAGRKVSASPKPAPVTGRGCSIPVSVDDKDGIEARKVYPVTADEIPDDPACCLLALPCLMKDAANA